MNGIEAVKNYWSQVKSQFGTGHALEHAYRPALQQLLNELDDVIAVNDPKHSDHGAPDFVLLRESNMDLVLGYGEAKDIKNSLDSLEKSEQFLRYSGYEKLFTTNYIDFRFYENGNKYAEVSIACHHKDGLRPSPESFSALWTYLSNFVESTPSSIKSGQELARIMGAKARRIRDEVLEILQMPDSEQERLRRTMKRMLVNDLGKEKFADLYAQTLVYGLFVARFNDPTPSSFSREEARDLVPSATPFLRVFFDHIAGASFEERLRRTVDELCQVFEMTDVVGIFDRYTNSKSGHSKDPVIYFYEDFLNAYDKEIRRKMGAFYTPLPVVHFIVNQIDGLLRSHFQAPLGLADTTTRQVEIHDGQVRRYRDRTTGGTKTSKSQIIEYHRIQILDPAVGTGTFLNEVFRKIHQTLSDTGQLGLWDSYVESSLLPRVHGFEYMMAPYTIGHLKLALTLEELGYSKIGSSRLGIYLTNSLEPGVPRPDDLFSMFGLSEAISREAQLASEVKNEKPILVILGNPPYLGESNNDTAFAESLVEHFKYEPDTNQKLQEANYKWLRNDYVKFLALAERRVNELGEGIVGMITPNSYLSMPTFRGMRYQLLKSFDELYILDLNGSLHSRDTDSTGRADQNVFDIEVGVSVLIAVKSEDLANEIASVYHHSIKGPRKTKFEFLEHGTVEWKELQPFGPMYAFRPFENTSIGETYTEFIPLKELFPLHSLGILTKKDSFAVSKTESELEIRIREFLDPALTDEEACLSMGLKLRDRDKWDARLVRSKHSSEELEDSITRFLYRPFDRRFVVYHPDIVARTNSRVLLPMKQNNVSLIVGRQGQAVKDMEWNLCFAASEMTDQNIFGRGGGTVFPLFADADDQRTLPNLDSASVDRLLSKIEVDVEAMDVFHYVYGVFSCKQYRDTFHDYLKDDFPRVPIPKSSEEFDALRKLGEQLVALHTGKKSVPIMTSFPVNGSNEVSKTRFEKGRLYINDLQYIDSVPLQSWEFHIGGYRVLQKWLKERKGEKLSFEDLLHLQSVIAILDTSRSLMDSVEDSKLSWLSL